MNIITRKQAKEQGLDRYYTGRPCKHNHDSERFLSNGSCIECAHARYSNERQYLIDKHGEEKGLALLRKKWAERAAQHRVAKGEAHKEYIREYMRKYRITEQGKENIKRANQRYHDKVKNEKLSNE